MPLVASLAWLGMARLGVVAVGAGCGGADRGEGVGEMKFDSSTTKPVFKEATKETPAVNPLPYALLPAVLAISAILVVFIAVGLLAWALGWSVRVPLGAAGGVALGLFIYAALNIDLVPYTIEKIVNHDLDGDGYVGEPPVPADDWKITLENERGNQQIHLIFPTEELRHKARLIAVLMANGTPFSEGALTGANRPLSRSEFNTMRDLLMLRGLMKWKDAEIHTLGVELTPPGRSTFRKLAAGDFTTTPRIHTLRAPEYAMPERVGEGGDHV